MTHSRSFNTTEIDWLVTPKTLPDRFVFVRICFDPIFHQKDGQIRNESVIQKTFLYIYHRPISNQKYFGVFYHTEKKKIAFKMSVDRYGELTRFFDGETSLSLHAAIETVREMNNGKTQKINTEVSIEQFFETILATLVLSGVNVPAYKTWFSSLVMEIGIMDSSKKVSEVTFLMHPSDHFFVFRMLINGIEHLEIPGYAREKHRPMNLVLRGIVDVWKEGTSVPEGINEIAYLLPAPVLPHGAQRVNRSNELLVLSRATAMVSAKIRFIFKQTGLI